VSLASKSKRKHHVFFINEENIFFSKAKENALNRLDNNQLFLMSFLVSVCASAVLFGNLAI